MAYLRKLKNDIEYYELGIECIAKGNYQDALRYFKASAQMGEGVEINYKKSFDYYSLSVEQSYAPAMSNMASLLINGGGVHKDHERAVKLLLRAAEAGDIAAYHSLGKMNLKYDNTELAVMYFLKGAKSECDHPAVAACMFTLGTMKELQSQGHLIPSDVAKAREWYIAAAKKGHIDATIALKERFDYYIQDDEEH